MKTINVEKYKTNMISIEYGDSVTLNIHNENFDYFENICILDYDEDIPENSISKFTAFLSEFDHSFTIVKILTLNSNLKSEEYVIEKLDNDFGWDFYTFKNTLYIKENI